MKSKLAASFRDLITTYYGSAERSPGRFSNVEELFGSYYGVSASRRRPPDPRARYGAMSVNCDDGEILEQRRKPDSRRTAPSGSGIPGADRASGVGQAPGAVRQPEGRPAAVTAASMSTGVGIPKEPEVGVQQEMQYDFGGADGAASDAGAIAPTGSYGPDAAAEEVSRKGSPATRGERPGGGAGASEDELAADLQAILSGRKVYDPMSKSIVEKADLAKARSGQADARPQPPAPSDNGQAIFDRIAQSMQYANAFDLGTVELQNRFADFDRMDDLKRRAAEERRAGTPGATGASSPPQPASAPGAQAAPARQAAGAVRIEQTAGPAQTPPTAQAASHEFIEDLDLIQSQRAEPRDPALFLGQGDPESFSRALYDTGEHVLAGGDLYTDRFLVGKSPGVLFSYGQIIAMADLFESVHQMMAAEAGELQRIKQLVERSAAYYKGGKSQSSLDVSNEEWEQATGGRYLKLAEDNYDHFAPNFLFKSAAFAKTASKHVNHKSAWEKHHEWAIKEAQKMALDPKNANVSYFPEWPLLINAFGDHFLTDAFAAGHVINKEAVIEFYKSKFYSKGELTDDARKFFRKVADKAFTGEVARKFKKLETGKPYPAWWNIVDWNPDIKNADRFSKVLIGAAEQEPDKIGNLAVKAIHDRLNKDGFEVTNGAGSGTWHLTGDGRLTPRTLEIMKQAVRQSADNILDPSILASNIAMGNYFAKVWKYVPRLTAASQASVTKLVRSYVDPGSDLLIDAASNLIHKELDSLIKVLIEKGALQPA